MCWNRQADGLDGSRKLRKGQFRIKSMLEISLISQVLNCTGEMSKCTYTYYSYL